MFGDIKHNVKGFEIIKLEDYESLSEKARLSKGDMLFGKVGASIGYCAIVSNDEKIAITQNIARLILKDNVNQLWLKGFLTSDEIQDWCQREAKGNAMKDLQINTIRNMLIFKCDIELQNKFAQIVEQIDKQKFVNLKIFQLLGKKLKKCYNSIVDFR